MSTDIRLKTALRHHRKIRRLVNRLGDASPWNLIQLWFSAAENRPDGVLLGYTTEDIADDAGWNGDPQEFVDTLVFLKWLDILPDGTYALHDWNEHQPYVVHAPERSEKARKAAEKRWGNAQRCKPDATSMLRACNEHTTSNANSVFSNAPDPSPSPDPSPDLKAVAAVVDLPTCRAPAEEKSTLVTAEALEPAPHPPSDADIGHMQLSEAANLYRQSFPGKQSLQVSPMVLAKLDVLISQYSRDEMLAGFDAVATAGANSLTYLEKTLEGKRADAQGQPRGKPHGRQSEAMRNLATWAQGDWLREEIATGMARLLADGKREGLPSADIIAVTAENYREALMPYQLTEEERPRVREMFEQVRKQCRSWPQSKELCDFLPRRREQDTLPEETQRGSPAIHLVDDFKRMKQA